MKYPITFDYERDKFCDADGNKIDHSVVTSTFNDLERRLKIAVDALEKLQGTSWGGQVVNSCIRAITKNALKAIQEGRDDRK